MSVIGHLTISTKETQAIIWTKWYMIGRWYLGNIFQWDFDKNTTSFIDYKNKFEIFFFANWRPSSPCHNVLTHWGRVTHICVSELTSIGSDNGLAPGRHHIITSGRRQAIIYTNAGILLIWPVGTNLSEIWIEINTFSFKKMHLKMSSGKWRPSCLGLNVSSSKTCSCFVLSPKGKRYNTV